MFRRTFIYKFILGDFMAKTERRVQIGASVSVTALCLAEKILEKDLEPNFSRLVDTAIKEYANTRQITLNKAESMVIPDEKDKN